MPSPYRGRFAPTPSGPLHLGSLLTAVASWLDARAHHGSWLVRIEDVDTPRCPPENSEIIIQQLMSYGLVWDETVTYQHSNHRRYEQALDYLVAHNHAYPCGCSRKDWANLPHYPGWCRHQNLHPDRPQAWRLNTGADNKILSNESGRASHLSLSQDGQIEVHWNDRRLGYQKWRPSEQGDVVLKRKDGLWAYQLAVIADDAAQGITHVVRGIDLLDNTPWQILLLSILNSPIPVYTHLPLLCSENGQKLSKQNLAPALPDTPIAIRQTLHFILVLLGLNPPDTLTDHCVEEQLQWGLAHWDMDKLPDENIQVSLPGMF